MGDHSWIGEEAVVSAGSVVLKSLPVGVALGRQVGFFRRTPLVFLAILPVVSASAVAVGVELLQLSLPGGFFDPAETALSLAGAVSGAGISALYSEMLRRVFSEK